MPAVKVAECETAEDVWRLARESAARRRNWNKQKPEPRPAMEPAIIPEPEVVPIKEETEKNCNLWMGRTASEIWREMRASKIPEESIDDVQPRPWIDDVIRAVARAYGFRSTDLKAARRDAWACQARHVSMMLSKMLTLRSYPFIGRMHGNRDHTTALHAVKKLSWLGTQLEAIHTLADPPSAWATSAARLHPLPTMARTYIRQPGAEAQ